MINYMVPQSSIQNFYDLSMIVVPTQQYPPLCRRHGREPEERPDALRSQHGRRHQAERDQLFRQTAGRAQAFFLSRTSLLILDPFTARANSILRCK